MPDVQEIMERVKAADRWYWLPEDEGRVLVTEIERLAYLDEKIKAVGPQIERQAKEIERLETLIGQLRSGWDGMQAKVVKAEAEIERLTEALRVLS